MHGCIIVFFDCPGLKPTWGLVPYTGIVPIEPTIDHTGPMTKTVADCALLLEVRRHKKYSNNSDIDVLHMTCFRRLRVLMD